LIEVALSVRDTTQRTSTLRPTFEAGVYGGRVCVAWDGNGCLHCLGEIDEKDARDYFAPMTSERASPPSMECLWERTRDGPVRISH